MEELTAEVIEFLGTLEPLTPEKEEDIEEEKTLETLNFN